MKKTFLNKLTICVLTFLFTLCGAFVSMFYSTDKNITASAETIEYQDLLGVENRSWGAHEGEYYFGGVTLEPFGYFNSDSSVCGTWYVGNNDVIAANNGVDIMEYIYVNGVSARELIETNAGGDKLSNACGCWLSNPAAYPVYVETTNGSGILIKIAKAHVGDSFTLTFKAGFELTRNDGQRIHVSDDIVYNCNGNVPTRVQKYTVTFNDANGNPYTTKRVVAGQAIGELPAVPEKSGCAGFWKMDGKSLNESTTITSNKTVTPAYALEYQDLWGIEDRTSWATDNTNIACFGGVTLEPFGYFITASGDCWYQGNNSVITQNNGVDIMQYIYVNGQCARDLLIQNQTDQKTMAGTGSWLSNPAAWPIAIETNGDVWIRIDKTAFGGDFTITFKKGFSLIRNDGETVYLSNDVSYTYANGVLDGRTVEKEYKLTFEGADASKTLKNGEAIGTLPAIPAKAGCEGVWMIDGVEITADTIYNYGANKTAAAVYSKNITETIGLGDWGVPESESDIRYLWIRNNGADIPTGYPNSYWNDHADNKNSNYGVDIMEYILIDGESARALINKNASGETSYKASSTFPLNVGACYAPVCLETAADGVRFKVMVAYKTSFTLTFKAGFTIVNAEGVRLYTTEDVVYNVGSNGGEISKVTGYTLTFEGAESRNIEDGATIGALPAVPANGNYEGAWAIDGEFITADTVYNYGANKTATAVYSKNITETIGLGDWGVPETESDIRYLWIRDNGAEIPTEYPNSYWNDHADNKDYNYGVDIMEYILIDGESMRALINKNASGETSYKASSTFPLSVGGCYAPVCLETINNGSDGVRFKVMVDYKTSFDLTFKAGFAIVNTEGVRLYVNEDVTYRVGDTMDNIYKLGQEYTLSFEGLTDSITVEAGQPIGELPAVPVNENDSDCEGVWTIDGVEITADTIYLYGANKTAVPSYSKDITKYIALEDRAWGGHEGEYYFGVLDMRESNKVVGESETYYLNSTSTIAGCWYVGNDAPITANGGVDIMEYIYVNGKSARELITENANGAGLTNSCPCWLSNPAASPVYVETTNGSGIMIRVLKAYTGDYFEITFKSGFSLINEDGVRVYLTDDITYKYVNSELKKGVITDEELDQLGGKPITLINGEEIYLTKSTRRLTLPTPESFEKDGVMQTFLGWTTVEEDPLNEAMDLYPAGYKFEPTAETTLYAVWIGFEMQDGAAARLTNGSAGIRFLANINGLDYQNLNNGFGVSKIGMIIAPTDYLNSVEEITHENFGFDNRYYSDIQLENWRSQDGDIWTYAAALVNIQEKQYARAMSARGYLLVSYYDGDDYSEEKYIYTPYTIENNSRSIYDVALKAYNDEETPAYKTNTTILNYINNVANLTWDVEDYSFARTEDVAGDYEVTAVSVEEHTVTVKVDGGITSALVNGKRLASGSSASNVTLGNFVFSVSKFKMIDGGFQFTIGAANNTYDKESEETLHFASSDEDLDFFLNDYFKRHSAYVEDGENLKVNTAIGGVNSQEFFSHEWMSMAYYWYNSFEGYVDEKGNNQDRIAGLRQFLSSVPVDDYGYVWSSNDRVRDADSEVSTGEQKMGWPFPNNDTVKTSHWEFNSGSESWSSNIGATASGGLYTKNVSNQSSNITFTSNSFASWTSKKIYTFYAPLLEFEVRIDDATNIEDIYVWYSTSSSTSFSDDKKVSVKEKAFLNYDLGNTAGAYNHVLYLPMYAESAWGESTSTYVKQLKIEIVLKSGKTISGNVGLNYVRPTLDTRMSNNNSILISSLRTDYDYTGDLDFLAENITRARKAMNFLMQMYDTSRGLKKESYLVGHGGTKEDLTLLGKATTESIASSISQGYWDIMYMPEYDFQSNTYFYKAVRDMAYLEEILSNNGITVNEDATVKTATRNRTTGTCAYNYDLNSVADTVLANLRKTTENTNHTGFWNATTGRFVAGYASGEGKWYDYGYVAWNLEAIYYGIATEEQATAIMNWLSSEDQTKLYKYMFAPISNMVTGDADMLNGEYAAQKDSWVNCQFGGAIMYTSFYDLMARIDTLGADNAFERLTAIKNWYYEVYNYYVANGSNPEDFYRYYYDNKGIQMQGMGTAGAVGLDDEFLESFLPVSAVAYGFFGIDSVDGKTLEIAPEMPADLSYWKMENLAFNKVKYDLKIFDNALQISNVRGDVEDLKFQIVLDCTDGQKIYVNGADYTAKARIENGKAYVTVDMGAVIVEVR